MAEEIKAAYPANAISQDPLREEARRNRRALLAVSALCLAIRFTGAFPTQISALGIAFSSAHQHRLIVMASIFEVYLVFVFIISAITDFVRWRHELRRAFTTYFQSNEDHEAKLFTPESAASAAIDELGTRLLRTWRLEAPPHRINHELQHYMTKKRGLYGMILNTYPYVLIHHALLFCLPVLLFIVSFAYLWTPSRP